jgi:hypothetical protein
MTSLRLTLAVAALFMFGTPALAHEGGLDARGEIVEVSAKRLVLKTPKGETKSFALSPETEVRRGKSPSKVSEIATGEKAVVHAKKSPRGEPEAMSIRLAKEAPATK